MPEVVCYVVTSLDGYDGSLDWLATFKGTEEAYGYAEFYSTVDALLLGSRTYEQSLAFGTWAYQGKPVEGGAVPASKARRCDPAGWVFSSRSLAAADLDVTVTAASPVDVTSELESHGLHRAWLIGGVRSRHRSEGRVSLPSTSSR